MAPTTLAITATTAHGGVAIVRADGSAVIEQSSSDGRHAEALVPSMERLFERARIDPRSIDLVVVDIGPGSFTGVRAGVAAAKGFALAVGKPIVGVASLAALANATRARASSPILAIIDARRGELFASLSTDDAILMEPTCAPPDAIAGEVRSREANDVSIAVPAGAPIDLAWASGPPFRTIPPFEVGFADHVDALATLGRARLARGDTDDVKTIDALYVRPSDAKLPAR